MKKLRLYCAKCRARKSNVEFVKATGKPKATCVKCGAEIPLYRDEYNKYHPVRVKDRVIVP